MLIEWFPAYAMLNALDRHAPQVLQPMPSREACLIDAEKRNRRRAQT